MVYLNVEGDLDGVLSPHPGQQAGRFCMSAWQFRLTVLLGSFEDSEGNAVGLHSTT